MPDRFFEEFEVGQRWVTRGRTVTEADIVNFSGLSADFHPLHVDQDYAAQTRFGQRIAQGFLVMSMATGMVPADPEKCEALYGVDKLRFLRPVFIGDTIHLEMEQFQALIQAGEEALKEYKIKTSSFELKNLGGWLN